MAGTVVAIGFFAHVGLMADRKVVRSDLRRRRLKSGMLQAGNGLKSLSGCHVC